MSCQLRTSPDEASPSANLPTFDQVSRPGLPGVARNQLTVASFAGWRPVRGAGGPEGTDGGRRRPQIARSTGRRSWRIRLRPRPPRGRRPAPRGLHPHPPAYGPEDFPGCESFHLPASELEGYEGRLEFWDGRTQTAWRVCEPTSTFHEVPSRMLPQVAREFAHLRGSPIKCYGSADLWIPARSGAARR